MLKTHVKALNLTHTYLQDLGANVAPAKSFNFCSTAAGRKWLAETWWEVIKSPIRVVTHMRYLGAHFSAGLARRNDTLVDRWNQAIVQLKRLRFIAADAKDNIHAILAKVYAGGMYGVEGNDVSEHMVAKLSKPR